jgi:predicted nucleic acid-binding Zn ribbon protein
VAGLQDRLREIAERASPRTGLLFALAFVLLVVWIVLAAFGVGD